MPAVCSPGRPASCTHCKCGAFLLFSSCVTFSTVTSGFLGACTAFCARRTEGSALWWSCTSVASRAGTRPPAAISPDRRETVFPLWFLGVQHGGAGPSPREGPGQCLTTRGTVSLASGVAPVCSRSQHSPLPLLARSERRANHVPAGHASLSSTGTGLVGRTPRLPPAP